MARTGHVGGDSSSSFPLLLFLLHLLHLYSPALPLTRVVLFRTDAVLVLSSTFMVPILASQDEGSLALQHASDQQ